MNQLSWIEEIYSFLHCFLNKFYEKFRCPENLFIYMQFTLLCSPYFVSYLLRKIHLLHIANLGVVSSLIASQEGICPTVDRTCCILRSCRSKFQLNICPTGMSSLNADPILIRLKRITWKRRCLLYIIFVVLSDNYLII